jgi:hypothetical protein
VGVERPVPPHFLTRITRQTSLGLSVTNQGSYRSVIKYQDPLARYPAIRISIGFKPLERKYSEMSHPSPSRPVKCQICRWTARRWYGNGLLAKPCPECRSRVTFAEPVARRPASDARPQDSSRKGCLTSVAVAHRPGNGERSAEAAAKDPAKDPAKVPSRDQSKVVATAPSCATLRSSAMAETVGFVGVLRPKGPKAQHW